MFYNTGNYWVFSVDSYKERCKKELIRYKKLFLNPQIGLID